MNELSKETSPYLLQHASNPVHWKPWNKRTLELAASQNKLILISVGYAACHWCHVMEHETFENEEAARIMNAHFINIKVDREERPDVDAVYMKAVQLMTKRGGWPMNVIALPDGRPVWGGTYFRTEEWMESLEMLASMWQKDSGKMIAYAEKLHEGINAFNLIPPNTEEQSGLESVHRLVQKWQEFFDPEWGGDARAPKFMLPSNLELLMHYAHRFQKKAILDHVTLTLDKMAMGGLYDTVGGGFSRYSVDPEWHIPHFEKMLYDNAQLIGLYSQAYQLTSDDFYREIVSETIHFAQTEWRTDQGNFHASFDADSPDVTGKKVEGAYYVWTIDQLKTILKDDFPLFSQVYNINPTGHWEHGFYVLFRTRNYASLAQAAQQEKASLLEKVRDWKYILASERKKRTPPALDNKTITSWNALMITGLCKAFEATALEAYRQQAGTTAGYLNRNCRDSLGMLLHTASTDQQIPGFLEDYALCAEAFLWLYRVTSEENWLHQARQFADHCLDAFYDDSAGFFRFNPPSDYPLISEHFEMEDNVIPASNSVLGRVLHLLGRHFENQAYLKLSEKMASSVLAVADYPSAFSNWMTLALEQQDQPAELILCGPEAESWYQEISKAYLPQLLIAWTSGTSELPLFRGRSVTGKTVGYLCRSQSCSLPLESVEEIKKMLND